jgi:hypothetical protein
MLIRELFEDFSDDTNDATLQPKSGGQMMQQLRQSALDVITPLLGQNVPFVTMDQMIDALSHSKFGIVITPSLIMSILDPDSVKAVSKIEGDRIFLAEPNNLPQGSSKDQQEKDQDHVSDMAASQIAKDMKS